MGSLERCVCRWPVRFRLHLSDTGAELELPSSALRPQPTHPCGRPGAGKAFTNVRIIGISYRWRNAAGEQLVAEKVTRQHYFFRQQKEKAEALWKAHRSCGRGTHRVQPAWNTTVSAMQPSIPETVGLKNMQPPNPTCTGPATALASRCHFGGRALVSTKCSRLAWRPKAFSSIFKTCGALSVGREACRKRFSMRSRMKLLVLQVRFDVSDNGFGMRSCMTPLQRSLRRAHDQRGPASP